MSTEIKSVLILVLVCAATLSMVITNNGSENNISSETISYNVAPTDTNEITESEIIEEPMEENEVMEDLLGQPSQGQAIENTDAEISTKNYNNYSVPSNNSIKSYMDYRHITSISSRQYQLQNSIAYTGNYGIRMVGDRYCVAVGSYYTTTIGQYIDIELENGNVIQGILADCKDDKHTDETNRINPNGSVVEFVVDTKILDETAKIMGDISYVNNWDSKIINIKVYDKVEKF